MTEKITVYSFRRCPFAMRVRLCLHEKELEFETVEEDLKNFSPELRALHPEAKVPVIVHNDTVVYESAIILEYIEDAFPDVRPIFPKSAALRVEVRLWGYWCNQHFKPAIDRLKYGTARFAMRECEGIETVVNEHLAKLEKRLQTTAWLVGETYTYADIMVFPFARQLTRISPKPPFLEAYPAFLNWVQRITERPAFEKTMA